MAKAKRDFVAEGLLCPPEKLVVKVVLPIWRGWRCECDYGNRHSDLYCTGCGKPRPEDRR